MTSGRGPSARLRRAVAADPTYREVGATTGTLPAGYRHVRRRRRIGTGAPTLGTAAEHLGRWDVHRGAGLDVEATSATAALGSTAVLRTGRGPLRVAAPCRVVLVLDEPRRRGFAYGTLPGHPETGEEMFALTLDQRDDVWFEVTAFSRPGRPWSALGAPVARRVQDHLTDRYVAVLASLV